MPLCPKIIELEEQFLFGVGCRSNDSTQRRDIPTLCRRLNACYGEQPALPLYIISSEYDEKSRNFKLFAACRNHFEKAEAFILPTGLYAELPVKPLFGLFWGIAIGRTKYQFYREWLPKSEFSARNLEYELHREDGSVVLRFAIERKRI